VRKEWQFDPINFNRPEFVMDMLKSSFIAMLATLFCIWLLRPLACRLGLVDSPGGRKVHVDDIPLIGGIAMFFGFCFALLFLNMSLLPYRGLLAGAALLVLIGVVDDFKELSSKTRLVGQLLAALFLIAWGGKIVHDLGNLVFIGSINLGAWAMPFTVFIVMGYLNSMNMIDGQDGLAGGIALTQTLCLMYLSHSIGNQVDVKVLLLLAALLCVFLAFNLRLPWRRHASIFMGDAGVTFVAFVIAWFAIDLAQSGRGHITPVTILWVLAFPVYDLINVMLYRWQQGRSLFQAGRDHVHHVLHVLGVDASLSTLLLCLYSLTLGVIGIAAKAAAVPESWQFIAWLASLTLYLSVIKIVRE